MFSSFALFCRYSFCVFGSISSMVFCCCCIRAVCCACKFCSDCLICSLRVFCCPLSPSICIASILGLAGGGIGPDVFRLVGRFGGIGGGGQLVWFLLLLFIASIIGPLFERSMLNIAFWGLIRLTKFGGPRAGWNCWFNTEMGGSREHQALSVKQCLTSLLLHAHAVLVVVVMSSAVEEGEFRIHQLLFLRHSLEIRSVSGHEFGQLIDDGPRLRI